MQQLSPLDGQFLNMEFGNCYQHIGVLSIYDPTTATGGKVRFKDILHTFQTRLERSPLFTRKLMELPLNLDFPYWVEDPDFDLEFHVRHIALPKLGDWRQLCIQVARLHSRPLDRARPLWEAYVIEGLGSVDDVACSIISVAVRRYLSEKGELPSRSLKAAMPVSLRSAEEAATEAGNNIEVADIEIHTNLQDPLKVLRAVQRTTSGTKEFREAVGADLLVEISKTMPSALQSIATRASARATRLGRPGIFPSNITITNVPGPPFHLYMTGAKCIRSYGVGMAQAFLTLSPAMPVKYPFRLYAVGSKCPTRKIISRLCRMLMKN